MVHLNPREKKKQKYYLLKVFRCDLIFTVTHGGFACYQCRSSARCNIFIGTESSPVQSRTISPLQASNHSTLEKKKNNNNKKKNKGQQQSIQDGEPAIVYQQSRANTAYSPSPLLLFAVDQLGRIQSGLFFFFFFLFLAQVSIAVITTIATRLTRKNSRIKSIFLIINFVVGQHDYHQRSAITNNYYRWTPKKNRKRAFAVQQLYYQQWQWHRLVNQET